MKSLIGAEKLHDFIESNCKPGEEGKDIFTLVAILFEEQKMTKADLHMHPCFYGPNKPDYLTEWPRILPIYKASSLKNIVERGFNSKVGVLALSSAQMHKEAIDHTYQMYAKQIANMPDDISSHLDEKTGIVHFEKNRRKLLIIPAQEVRTNYQERKADVNILGLKDIIMPEEEIDETIKRALGNGGIVGICHPLDRSGVGLEKAVQLYEEGVYHGKKHGKVHYIEISGESSPEINRQTKEEFEKNGIKVVPVSDSHHYSQMASSHVLFNEELLQKFSIEELGRRLRQGEFTGKEGSASKTSRFVHHTFPILASLPGWAIKNPEYIISVLAKRK